MGRLRQYLARLLKGYVLSEVDPAALEAIYQRRFAGRDRQRFIEVWCEIARISRREPHELHEDDVLRSLGVGKAWFPEVVRDEIVEYASWETRGVPETNIETVGELVDWILDESSRGGGVDAPRDPR
jgi:hypothetical protein